MYFFTAQPPQVWFRQQTEVCRRFFCPWPKNGKGSHQVHAVSIKTAGNHTFFSTKRPRYLESRVWNLRISTNHGSIQRSLGSCPKIFTSFASNIPAFFRLTASPGWINSNGNSNSGTPVPISHTTLIRIPLLGRGSHYWRVLEKSSQKAFLQLHPLGCEAKRRVVTRSLWPLPFKTTATPPTGEGFYGLSMGQMRYNYNYLLKTLGLGWRVRFPWQVNRRIHLLLESEGSFGWSAANSVKESNPILHLYTNQWFETTDISQIKELCFDRKSGTTHPLLLTTHLYFCCSELWTIEMMVEQHVDNTLPKFHIAPEKLPSQ